MGLAGRARVAQRHTRLRRSLALRPTCLSGWDSDGTEDRARLQTPAAFGCCVSSRQSLLVILRSPVPSLRSTLPAPITGGGHPCGHRGSPVRPALSCAVQDPIRVDELWKTSGPAIVKMKPGLSSNWTLCRHRRSLVHYGQAKTQEKSRGCEPRLFPSRRPPLERCRFAVPWVTS